MKIVYNDQKHYLYSILDVAIMIPKTIHYVWLSGDEKPVRIQQCIDSWNRLMPDYEIVEWDMERVKREVPGNPWLDRAIEQRVWAFATDYLRLWILYNYGGIYLDSDVRTIKCFDPFLVHRGFSGIEYAQITVKQNGPFSGIHIEAAVIGSEKGHSFIKSCLDFYDGREFDVTGLADLTIPKMMCRIAEPYGFRYDHQAHQVLDGDFHIYPFDYFTTQWGIVGDVMVSENTVAIHLATGTWLEKMVNNRNRRKHHPVTYLRIYTKDYCRQIGKDILWIFSPRRKQMAERLRQIEKK